MGLKGIPSIISPELLKTLAEMGHGDTIGKCVYFHKSCMHELCALFDGTWNTLLLSVVRLVFPEIFYVLKVTFKCLWTCGKVFCLLITSHHRTKWWEWTLASKNGEDESAKNDWSCASVITMRNNAHIVCHYYYLRKHKSCLCLRSTEGVYSHPKGANHKSVIFRFRCLVQTKV